MEFSLARIWSKMYFSKLKSLLRFKNPIELVSTHALQDGFDDAKEVIELLHRGIGVPQPRKQVGALCHRLPEDGVGVVGVRPVLSQLGHVSAQRLQTARPLEVAAEEGLV